MHLTSYLILQIKKNSLKVDCFQVNCWSGSLEIGVVDCDPMHFDFPPCASKIQRGSWVN